MRSVVQLYGTGYDFWRTGSSPFVNGWSNKQSGAFVQSGFIERLREVVEHAGGQKELERLSGVDQTTISAWLKRVKNPKFQTVKKIADATGFCPEWLYLGIGPKRSRTGDDEKINQESLDVDLLASILEHVDSALAIRGELTRSRTRQRAEIVAAAYDYYRRSGKSEVRRSKILELLRRHAL